MLNVHRALAKDNRSLQRIQEEAAGMTDTDIMRSPEEFKKKARERAYNYECEFHGCSQAVLRTFQELLGLEDELLFKAAGPLCAGLGSGKSCGALAAGVMVLGMVHGRSRLEEGIGGLLKGFELAQALVRRFEQEFGTSVCYEISGVDWTDMQAVTQFLATPGDEKACEVAGKTAEIVADLLVEEASRQTPAGGA
jgi:C_GCAxxG_C_C family probable redox protein